VLKTQICITRPQCVNIPVCKISVTYISSYECHLGTYLSSHYMPVAVLVDTRQWYHDTHIDAGEMSLTISSEYG